MFVGINVVIVLESIGSDTHIPGVFANYEHIMTGVDSA